jgi:DnaJ-class molecular chaperone
MNTRETNTNTNTHTNNNNSSKQVFQLFKDILPHAVKLAQNYTHDDIQRDYPNNYEKPTPILKNINITMQQVYHGASIPLLVERWIIVNKIKTFETETMYISIPKGVDQNEMIVLREKGNIVNEYLIGDVKIFIQIENNSEFKRDGLNLILEKTISLKEALCGFTFDFLFLNGKRYMINTEGTLISPEYQKNISKMGLTRGIEDIGDLIIIFHVIFPSELSCEKISSLKEIL